MLNVYSHFLTYASFRDTTSVWRFMFAIYLVRGVSSLQKFDNKKVEAQVIELLERTPTAVSIDYVAHHLEMSWSTSRGLLLNMALKGLVEAEKTTKSLIFRLPKKDGEEK